MNSFTTSQQGPSKRSNRRQYRPRTHDQSSSKADDSYGDTLDTKTSGGPSWRHFLSRSKTLFYSSNSGTRPEAKRHHRKSEKPSRRATLPSSNGRRHETSHKCSSKDQALERSRGANVSKTASRARPSGVSEKIDTHILINDRPKGTRGLFVPAYRSPEHFGQQYRLQNPCLPLPLNYEERFKSKSQVVVRFYNCENFNFGRDILISPDEKQLVGAATAFLGECNLRDIPDACQPQHPNSAYRGLTLEGAHGGCHLHYPDCAGVDPFHRNVGVDWGRVMRLHAQKSPDTVLLIGVGLGEAGTQCQAGKTRSERARSLN
ncbi:hypothetical protein F5Y19DRAFT_472852 [Xylariaceae sp. FL1651]|nr:hypothetical protein F5Y19DRAFT_472852 [Xylariaceae sp. FL1651]